MRNNRHFFRVGLPTIIALIIVAAMLIIFATPLKYATDADSSDFDSLTMFSVEYSGSYATFTLPDASFNENVTITLSDLDKGSVPLSDISQVNIKNNSSLFKIIGQNIKITDNSAYVILTGYRQAIISSSVESYGFAIHLTKNS